VLQRGIPFEVKYPEYKDEVIAAMEEAKRISHDPNTKRYNSFEEALEDIENEI
jgi:DNA-damage-inducible protein J